MSTRNNLVTLLVVAVATAILIQNAGTADTYYVGDSLGWQVPPGGAVAFTNWSSQYTFELGDILVFNFTTGQHTAAKVTKEAFDACNITNPLSIETNGPANFTLNATGENYFICTTSNHCAMGGQKLSINVTSRAESPSGNDAQPPPPPPPPPPSSAPPTAIATFSLIIFMSITVAFLS
ncbi:stellacyanin-like [Cornus florida]|uniref:stellacyanin-like n=1 Tax=Cornus florida TaxID=4283 RepID=UPI00289B3360|nr:stellacyanin-like [Cornus florida]XP_059645928.1 stellacyanin-like [Cornus florida]